MEGLKQECQKFYDLLASNAPGVQGHTIELIMRTLDQDGMQASQNCTAEPSVLPNNGGSNNNNAGSGGSSAALVGDMQHQQHSNHSLMTSIDGMSGASIRLNQAEADQLAAATMELHPSMVLQSLGMSGGGDEEDRASINISASAANGSSSNNNNVSNDTSNVNTNNSSSENNSGGGGNGERPHICQICNASYKTRTHLRRHMFVHLNNRPYPCTDCGKGFNRKEHLTKHIEAVHSGTKHKCQYCGKEISRKDHLSRHIKNMHPALVGITKETDPSVLKVQLPCGQKQQARLSFLTPTFSPTSSMSSVSNSPSKGVRSKSPSHQSSESSGAESQSEQEPDSHNMSMLDQAFQHFTQVSIVPGGSIIVPGALPGQIAATVTVGSPIVPTSPTESTHNMSTRGSSSSESPTEKKYHSSNNNSASPDQPNGLLGLTNLSMSLGGQMREAPFAECENNSLSKNKSTEVLGCTECNASFTSEKELAAHLRSHKPQNFRCTECPRAYTRREKLTEHIRCFHQGQKFKCEYCRKELSRKDHVLRHVRSIHPEVLASRFTAHLQETSVDCGQDTMNGNLVLSSGNSGNITSSSAMNEMGVLLRSVCHVCLKVFGTSYHLSRHIESCHNGDIRPYSCNSCSKQFKRKDHLTKHMKSHCPSTRDGNGSNRTAPEASSRSKVPNPAKSTKSEHAKSGSGSGKSKKNKQHTVNSLKHEMQTDKTENTRIKEADTDFNLAMINSFIAENVNVVVEENDLSNLDFNE